jgi:hypothetical protein
MSTRKTSTITVKKNTKARLESTKGKKDWESFLEELYLEKRKEGGTSSIANMRKLLTDKDLEQISETSKKFGKEFYLH